MDENNKPFRFLSDEELLALSGKEKLIYLTMATQELETRQRKLREQIRVVLKGPPETKS
jgi:hypothetical protein